MHEFSFMTYLLDTVEEQASRLGGRKVIAINLALGERSGIDDSLLFYFDQLTLGTLAEGARLNIRRTAMRFRCERCERDYAPVPARGLRLPGVRRGRAARGRRERTADRKSGNRNMSIQTVKIIQNLLAANDQAADRNRQRFRDAGALAVNVMASPGAGKTSLIIKTMDALRGKAAVGVIEGDIDTEKVLAAGAVDAVQINTGGNCHLEAGMVQQALDNLVLERRDIVFIENVGNLICPTHWALGEDLRLCLLSAAEGHDKPVKYPDIFAAAAVIVLNKVDLIDLVEWTEWLLGRRMQREVKNAA